MMPLKWSRYNFLLEIKEETRILYNSYNNLLLQLDEELYNLMQNLSKSTDIYIDCIHAFTNEEIDFFEKNQILVENDESLVDMMHNQSMERIYNKKHLVLTIAPTQNCNFNCTYCYEKWRTPGGMSDETENALINYLKYQITNHGLESLSLTWYGGEPLLEKQRINSLGLKIKALGLEMLEHEVITNAYLLDEDSIAIFNSIGVTSIQVTLDGFKEIHDKTRPLVGGKGTFDKIIQNLDNLFNGKHRDNFSVAIRVNVDKSNIDVFLSFHEWLNDRYSSGKLLVYPGWIYLDDSNPSKCNCLGRNEATDFCIDLLKNHGIRTEEIFPDDINMECLIRNTNNITIGWQGEIYKCYEDIGNEDLIIGNIHNNPIWSNYELISQYSVGIDHYTDTECRDCSYLPICRGGCPKRRYENKYLDKCNDCCTPFKGRLEDYLSLYHDEFIKNNQNI